MSKIFGANWWTTLWGFVTLIAGAIAVKPTLIGFLPDPWEPYVSGVAGIIVFLAGGTFAVGVKSRNVTGGTVQQTADGSVASHTSQLQSGSVVDTVKANPKI